MEDRHVHTGNWYLRDRVRKLVLVIKSFCLTHVTGGCSSLEQILGLVGTDGVDYYPPADICKECKDIKKEGAYTTVARDRLRIKNPTRISMQKGNEASAKAHGILIPFLQEKLNEYDIEVERINLRYADGCLTKYDDVQTVFIDPNEITKHFDGVLAKKDYHATHYILSKHLYPKQFKAASDNQFSVMFNFHGQDCGQVCNGYMRLPLTLVVVSNA